MTKLAFITCPKRKPYRDPHLLKMARGQQCLLNVPGVCNHNPETTVSCHSNLLIHGKGMSQKAHDAYTAYGCSSCHVWLDQGKASAEEKESVFMSGHARQKVNWWDTYMDKSAPKKDRESAKAALDFIEIQETEKQLEWVR